MLDDTTQVAPAILEVGAPNRGGSLGSKRAAEDTSLGLGSEIVLEARASGRSGSGLISELEIERCYLMLTD